MVAPTEREVVQIAMAYAGFVHDRLVASAPGVTALRIDGNPGGPDGRSLRVTRRYLEDGHVQLRSEMVPAPNAAADDISVPASHDGVRVGTVTIETTGTNLESPALLARLTRYARVTAAGLAADLPPDAWPTTLHGEVQTVVDHETHLGAHPERVAGYSRIIVAALRGPLGLTDDFTDAVDEYAPLHDVGELAVGIDILTKPGRLGPDEWRLMQTHTTRGRRIVDVAVAEQPELWARPDVLRAIVEAHHEALDGSGYPHGLSGDAIPLEARIVSVADVFDALTSSRPYKSGWSADEALDEMDRMVRAGRIDALCLTALVTHPDLVEAVAASAAEIRYES